MLNKAYILVEDIRNAVISDNGTYKLSSSSVYLLQNINYTLRRCRQVNGTPYNTTSSVILQFSVLQSVTTSFKIFYDSLKSNHSMTFSVVFDADLQEGDKLKDYASAMVFSGYVVDVEETFHGGLTEVAANRMDEQMFVSVKVVLDHLTYVGQSDDVNITFYNNY